MFCYKVSDITNIAIRSKPRQDLKVTENQMKEIIHFFAFNKHFNVSVNHRTYSHLT